MPAQAPGRNDPYESPVDQLGNAALDAIEAGRYDEAERLCAKLLAEYPNQLDGHHRMGRLRNVQGRFAEAADHYAKALEIVKRNRTGYDPGLVQLLEKWRQDALGKAKAKPQP